MTGNIRQQFGNVHKLHAQIQGSNRKFITNIPNSQTICRFKTINIKWTILQEANGSSTTPNTAQQPVAKPGTLAEYLNVLIWFNGGHGKLSAPLLENNPHGHKRIFFTISQMKSTYFQVIWSSICTSSNLVTYTSHILVTTTSSQCHRLLYLEPNYILWVARPSRPMGTLSIP